MSEGKDETVLPLLPIEGLIPAEDGLCVDDTCSPPQVVAAEAKATGSGKPPKPQH